MDELHEEERIIISLVHSDPDYVVDVLGISSQELMDAFPDRVTRFLKEELG